MLLEELLKMHEEMRSNEQRAVEQRQEIQRSIAVVDVRASGEDGHRITDGGGES